MEQFLCIYIGSICRRAANGQQIVSLSGKRAETGVPIECEKQGIPYQIRTEVHVERKISCSYTRAGQGLLGGWGQGFPLLWRQVPVPVRSMWL